MKDATRDKYLEIHLKQKTEEEEETFVPQSASKQHFYFLLLSHRRLHLVMSPSLSLALSIETKKAHTLYNPLQQIAEEMMRKSGLGFQRTW